MTMNLCDQFLLRGDECSICMQMRCPSAGNGGLTGQQSDLQKHNKLSDAAAVSVMIYHTNKIKQNLPIFALVALECFISDSM